MLKSYIFIARINPFSGCSDCLEASYAVCDANRLTGFPVRGVLEQSIRQSSFAFITKENLVQRNLFLVVAIGDFNAKSSNWFS